jgi:signal transduction histidine kinase
MNKQLSNGAARKMRAPADSEWWNILRGTETNDQPTRVVGGRELDSTISEPARPAPAFEAEEVSDRPASAVLAETPSDPGANDLKHRLAHCQKMETLGRLTGRVAHDFNNLLTVIRGYSDMLQQCLGEDDPLRSNLVEQIQKAADMGASLTWQLLTYSRKPGRVPARVDLGSLLTDMDKMLRLLLNRNIELVRIQDRELGRVEADPGRMEQVIVNLVLNARDAMPGGGKLTLETAAVNVADPPASADGSPRLAGRYALLAVSDTGCGMDPITRAHVFEPFFTTKEVGRGTGLGLAVARDIVEAVGGFIEVASAPGQGTVVRVFLPLATSAAMQCA